MEKTTTMRIGRQKPTFRLRIIDITTDKSKSTTIYTEEDLTLEQIYKKIIKGLNSDFNE